MLSFMRLPQDQLYNVMLFIKVDSKNDHNYEYNSFNRMMNLSLQIYIKPIVNVCLMLHYVKIMAR